MATRENQGHGDHEFQMQRRLFQGPHLRDSQVYSFVGERTRCPINTKANLHWSSPQGSTPRCLGLCGIYVDDCLSVGPRDIVTSFLEHLRAIWKTTDPMYLTGTITSPKNLH